MTRQPPECARQTEVEVRLEVESRTMVLLVTAILVLVESSSWWGIELIVRTTEHGVYRSSIEIFPSLILRTPE